MQAQAKSGPKSGDDVMMVCAPPIKNDQHQLFGTVIEVNAERAVVSFRSPPESIVLASVPLHAMSFEPKKEWLPRGRWCTTRGLAGIK